MLKLAIVGVAMLLSSKLVGKPEDVQSVPHHSQFQYNQQAVDPFTRQQVQCLASNIYFEGRNQSDRGKIAIGLVTMNRVHSKDFAKSVCTVVEQRTRGTCQFSWWCNAKLRARAIARRFVEQEVYDDIHRLAAWIYFYHNRIEDFTHGATFYHATYVQPGWKNVEKTVRIDDHVFYKKRNANRNTYD